MSYRDDVDALRVRHAALEAQVEDASRERDEVARMLDEATARARLPVLDNITIASRCRADWNEMTGDDRVRHCRGCDKQVFNLSEMTRDEATALVLETAGELCARYFQRHDGTIVLADCTIGRRRKRRVAMARGALLAAGAGLAALAMEPREVDEPTVSFDEPQHDDGQRTLVDLFPPPSDIVPDPSPRRLPRFTEGSFLMGASRNLELTVPDELGDVRPRGMGQGGR